MIKKIIFSLIIVIVIFFMVMWIGVHLIKSSPVYEISKIQVKNEFGLPSSDLNIKWFSPMSFSEGAYSGSAEFVLCNKENCFGIKAQKPSGIWEITGIVKQ